MNAKRAMPAAAARIIDRQRRRVLGLHGGQGATNPGLEQLAARVAAHRQRTTLRPSHEIRCVDMRAPGMMPGRARCTSPTKVYRGPIRSGTGPAA